MSETTATATDTGTTDATDQDATTDTGSTDTSTDATTTVAAGPDTDADARVTRANKQAQQYRTQLRATETELQGVKDTLSKLAAVFNPDGGDADPDPKALTGQVEQLTTEAAQLRAELLVHTLAGDNGGNPVALLDSRGFTTTLHGLDPAADDYHDQVAAAIKDAVSKSPNLRSGQAPSAGGAADAGQGAGDDSTNVTAEQFKAMDYNARAELYRRDPALYRKLAGTA